MTEVVLLDVRTADVTPSAPPYRISGVPTKDRARVRFQVHGEPGMWLSDGNFLSDATYLSDDLFLSDELYFMAGSFLGALPPVRAYRVKLGGASPIEGFDLGSKGAVCGGFTAGELACGDTFFARGDETIVEDIDWPEAIPAGEGTHTVNIYGAAGGWG